MSIAFAVGAIVAWGGLAASIGCSGTSPEAVARCVPGAQLACACPGTAIRPGVQVCSADGTLGTCECSAASANAPQPATPEGETPQADTASTEESRAHRVRERVRDLRARPWASSPIRTVTLLNAVDNLGCRGNQRGVARGITKGNVLWSAEGGIEVRLFATSEDFEDVVDPNAGLRGSVLGTRVEVRGQYPGASRNGSVLVRERTTLPFVASEPAMNMYTWAASREDGLVLLGFDSYEGGRNGVFVRRCAKSRPSHTRRLLLVWDDEVSQPIAVADWNGAIGGMPGWASPQTLEIPTDL